MLVALASDHAGFDLKEHLKALVEKLGHQAVDLGTYSRTPVDYPDFAEALGKSVRAGEADRGVLICGSGVGAAVAVNKVPGIRGSVCHDTYSAHQGVEHDNMNVLVLGARVIGTALAEELLQTYLKAEFSNEERHVKRLAKVLAMEERFRGGKSPTEEAKP